MNGLNVFLTKKNLQKLCYDDLLKCVKKNFRTGYPFEDHSNIKVRTLRLMKITMRNCYGEGAGGGTLAPKLPVISSSLIETYSFKLKYIKL